MPHTQEMKDMSVIQTEGDVICQGLMYLFMKQNPLERRQTKFNNRRSSALEISTTATAVVVATN